LTFIAPGKKKGKMICMEFNAQLQCNIWGNSVAESEHSGGGGREEFPIWGERF